MKVLISTVCLALSLVFHAYAGTNVNPQATWLAKEFERLKNIKDIKSVEMKNFKPGIGSVSSLSPDCRVQFADKSWVLAASHSSHQEDAIGDITIILASDGKYYFNSGHCCPELILSSKDEILSLHTFLKATGLGENGEPIPWKEYRVPLSDARNAPEASQDQRPSTPPPVTQGEQGAAGQPATRPETKPEGSQKPQPKSEVRSR